MENKKANMLLNMLSDYEWDYDEVKDFLSEKGYNLDECLIDVTNDYITIVTKQSTKMRLAPDGTMTEMED
jgi:hypothetical protein